jgi:hypothetical protein
VTVFTRERAFQLLWTIVLIVSLAAVVALNRRSAPAAATAASGGEARHGSA